MYPGEHFWWWGGFWMFPMVIPLVFIAILIAAFYFIFRRSGGRPPWGDSPHSESALEVLKKRYAKGEITKEEFDRIKKDILS